MFTASRTRLVSNCFDARVRFCCGADASSIARNLVPARSSITRLMLSSLSLCASPEIRAGYIIRLILPATAMASRAGKRPNHLYIVRIDTKCFKHCVGNARSVAKDLRVQQRRQCEVEAIIVCEIGHCTHNAHDSIGFVPSGSAGHQQFTAAFPRHLHKPPFLPIAARPAPLSSGDTGSAP